MPEPAEVLELRQVAKDYRVGHRRVTALTETDLAVRAGEVVGVGGHSGSGKSTLLRMLAAIEPPDRGQVWLGGEPAWVRRRRALRRRAPRPGYVMPVFQDPLASLDRRWPIWRSITEPLLASAHTPRRHRRAVARERLAQVGLAHLDVAARPTGLSVGQCQRVALARALVAQPAAIVADEPTSALDLTSAAGVMHLLREAAGAGMAVVVVSHDDRMLGALADRLVHIDHGRVQDLY